MTKEHLRQVRDANPFSPFTIRLADGRDFRIHHRDFLSIPPDGAGRIAVIYQSGGAFSLVDLLLVTEVSVEPQPNQTNGHSPTNQ
jgi:hypothetical protein